MPRGNDTEGNRQWNEDALAAHGILGNAEDMIRAHRANIDRSAMKAMLIREDEEATAEANADLEATAEKLGILPDSGVELLAAAVHGNAVIGVVETTSGLTYKVLGPWNDKYVAPKLTAQERAQLEEATAHHEVAAEIARMREEHEIQMADIRADAEAQLAEALREIRDSHSTAPAGEDDDDDGDDEQKGPPATAGARKLAADKNVDLADVTGTGKDGKIGQPDVAKYLADHETKGD